MVATRCQTKGCTNWTVSGKNHCSLRMLNLHALRCFSILTVIMPDGGGKRRPIYRGIFQRVSGFLGILE